MNLVASDVKPFADELKPLIHHAKWCLAVVCVPYVMIPAAKKAFRDSRVAVGAQDVSAHAGGAYTGEVSAAQLRDLGVDYVIVGHSERRQYHGETDLLVTKKVHAALEAGLRPIICVGESEEQRDLGITLELVALQVKTALANVPADKVRRVVFAYEPIWAIGTGKTATAAQAGEVCTEIRAVIRKLYGAKIARAVTVQYGGSMNEKNAGSSWPSPTLTAVSSAALLLRPKNFLI
jgi:triosephosphate isomerase